MRLLFLRCVPVALVAALVASAALPPVARADELLPQACHPVHVVQVAGTGFSNSQAPDLPAPLLFDLWNPGETLQEKFGVTNVSAMSVPYPASLGRVNAFSPTWGGHESYTYGESVLQGVNTGRRELEAVASHCPETKYLIVGYSQGASVAGDLAADISAGKVAGVHPEAVAGVVLVADPGRSLIEGSYTPQASVIYGPIPPGVKASGGEIINGGGTGVLEGRYGMTGSRPRNFNNLHGKVLSLCDSRDMACSTPVGSIIHTVASHANRVEWTGTVDSTSGQVVAAIMDAVKSGQDVEPILARNGYGLLQLPAIIASVDEVASYYRVVEDGTQAPLPELVGAALINALPELAYEGVSNAYLVQAATAAEQALAPTQYGDYAGVVAESIRAFAAAESLYWQLFHLGALPRYTTPEQARQEWVRNLLSNLSRTYGPKDGTFQLAGKFGYAHMTYFRHGFYVEGKLGYRYADAWLEDVTRAVLDGNSARIVY